MAAAGGGSLPTKVGLGLAFVAGPRLMWFIGRFLGQIDITYYILCFFGIFPQVAKETRAGSRPATLGPGCLPAGRSQGPNWAMMPEGGCDNAKRGLDAPLGPQSLFTAGRTGSLGV